MKHLKKYSKLILKSLILMLLFQSCSVYLYHSFTVDEAVESKQGVKVTMNSGKKIKYAKIIMQDSIYYGVQKKDSIALELEAIQEIRIRHKTLSIIASVLTFGLSLLIVAGFAGG